MTISEQIKILCVRCDISLAGLSRKLGTSPQNFSARMKRQNFTIDELEQIAQALDVEFKRHFVLKNGDIV